MGWDRTKFIMATVACLLLSQPARAAVITVGFQIDGLTVYDYPSGSYTGSILPPSPTGYVTFSDDRSIVQSSESLVITNFLRKTDPFGFGAA